MASSIRILHLEKQEYTVKGDSCEYDKRLMVKEERNSNESYGPKGLGLGWVCILFLIVQPSVLNGSGRPSLAPGRPRPDPEGQVKYGSGQRGPRWARLEAGRGGDSFDPL